MRHVENETVISKVLSNFYFPSNEEIVIAKKNNPLNYLTFTVLNFSRYRY